MNIYYIFAIIFYLLGIASFIYVGFLVFSKDKDKKSMPVKNVKVDEQESENVEPVIEDSVSSFDITPSLQSQPALSAKKTKRKEKLQYGNLLTN